MAIILSAEEAVKRIPDGATVFVLPMPLEEVFPAFYRVYEETGSPRDLTVVWAAGIGPFNARINKSAQPYPGNQPGPSCSHLAEPLRNHALREIIGFHLIGTDYFYHGMIQTHMPQDDPLHHARMRKMVHTPGVGIEGTDARRPDYSQITG